MSSFIAWIMAVSLLISGNKASVTREFATAVAQEVTENPLSKDIRFDALVYIEMAWQESAYKEEAIGDYGDARCSLQVHVLGASPDGWTPKEVSADAHKCVHTAAYIMQYSFKICRKHPLAPYASGSCTNRAGIRISDYRMWHAHRAYEKMKSVYIEVHDNE